MNFEKAKICISSIGRNSKTNHQQIVIRHLLSCENFTDLKTNISEIMAKEYGYVRPVSFYGNSNAVWNALRTKKCVNKTRLCLVNKIVSLEIDPLTPAQKRELVKICEGLMN